MRHAVKRVDRKLLALGRIDRLWWLKLQNPLSHERYVVKVGGIAKAEYPVFVKAMKASLQLRQELPSRCVKLRDASDETAH